MRIGDAGNCLGALPDIVHLPIGSRQLDLARRRRRLGADIKVVAQDLNKMARDLEAKAKLRRLTGPAKR